MKVIAFPKRGIAYNDAFYAAVEAAGTEVIEGELGRRWLSQHLQRGDVIHLATPEELQVATDGVRVLLGTRHVRHATRSYPVRLRVPLQS